MTAQAHEWLPADALVDRRFYPVIDEALSRWNERWLGTSGSYALSSFKRIKPAAASPSPRGDWRQSSTGMVCRWNESLAHGLALAIVDATDRKSPRSMSDKALLAELAWESLSDLAAMLAKSLQFSPAKGADGPPSLGLIEWQIHPREKHLPDLALRLPASSFVAARKALIGTKFFAVESSGPLSRACADAGLCVEAVLGNAQISWGDLETLEPGDVVVLDQLMADSFPLLSAKSGAELCRLSLSQAKDRLELVMA